jgi:hypothetical protein
VNEETSAGALETMWARALDAWDDDGVHAAILQYALRTEALPELAGRYRALLGDPSRAPFAQKRIDAIVVAATQMLVSQKTPAAGKTPLSITLSAVGVALFLLGWLGWAMLGRR